MTKVLITGANGLLGRTLVQKCLMLGWVVDCVVNESADNIVTGVRRISRLGEIDKNEAYQYVFHLASFIPYGAYNNVDDRFIATNLELTLTLHKTFKEAKLIFASSVSVYGSNEDILTEKSGFVVPTLYGLSKIAGEFVVSNHPTFAIIRFSSLYGKGMTANTFLPRIISDAITKKNITLLGTGHRQQNYLSVEDAADYCVHAALYGDNEAYLGVSPYSYANSEVAQMVITEVENSKVSFQGEDSSPSFIYDNSYSRLKLQFEPKVDLKQGIKELING